MTKAELIKALEDYNNYDHVFMSFEGATQIFHIDGISTTSRNQPVLEMKEAVSFDDICGLAEECLDAGGLSEKQKEILYEVIA